MMADLQCNRIVLDLLVTGDADGRGRSARSAFYDRLVDQL